MMGTIVRHPVTLQWAIFGERHAPATLHPIFYGQQLPVRNLSLITPWACMQPAAIATGQGRLHPRHALGRYRVVTTAVSICGCEKIHSKGPRNLLILRT